MPQFLTPEKMPDAVIATLNKLNKGQWVGEMTDLTEHVGLNQMIRDKRTTQSSGRGLTVRYVMDHNHSAQQTGLFGTVDFSRDDAMKEGTIPWRYTDGNMVYDKREPAMNSGPEEIVDLVKTENARMMTAIAELAENQVWGAPAGPDDDGDVFGVDYWVTKNATLGYNGGNHANFPGGRAGVSSADYPRHKNFTGAYSSVDDADDTGLIYMLEMAADKTKWMPPAPEPGMGSSSNKSPRSIYCNWETKNAMKNVAKANNDSLGFDLSTQTPVFRGAGIKYVPFFDSMTDNPVYMLDHRHLHAKFLKNWFNKRMEVTQLPGQPYCFGIIVSWVWNIVCYDVRRQVVFHQA